MSIRRHRWLSLFLLLFVLFIALGAAFVLYLEQDLPNVDVLKDVQMQVPLRIYSADNQLIGEYGEKRRLPVSLDQIPKNLINALVATEDRRFWQHSGVDFLGLARAAVQLVTTGHKTQGGSTITMQVARNFFLTRKKTYIRKLREILLALKMGRELSKDKVLELYLNKVYFGQRAYGVAAAAQIYYGAQLQDLSLAQMAMLAGLPQAPSAINPLSNPTAAKARRQHVLTRMLEQHYINQAQFEQANNTPLSASRHHLHVQLSAPYVAEEVRDNLVKRYGDNAYTMGLTVYTSIDSRLQKAANNAVRNAVLNYDKRHGYRGPIANWGDLSYQATDDLQKRLRQLPIYNTLYPALVTAIDEQKATVLMADGQSVDLPWKGMQWAGKALENGRKGPAPKALSDILTIGDVVYTQQQNDNSWQLSQVPEAEGALVALNPDNGGISALVGGFSYVKSKFDRVMQANRQPGSGFKPFVYSAALHKGYTLATLVNDAPIVAKAANNVGIWRPRNDSRQFYGPTRLRIGLMKSRNLVTIRLLQEIGINYAINYIKPFGFSDDNLPRNLTLALGAGDIKPIQLATGYASFANGGYKIAPYLISKIRDNNGHIIMQAKPSAACDNCDTIDSHQTTESAETAAVNSDSTTTNNIAPRIISAQNAYLISSAMRSVIQQGTGRAAKVLKRNDLSGKTGTTNDKRDAWFNGFNRHLVVISWMGFDQPRSLYEYGAQAALPMWIDFMRQALKDEPEATLARPAGLVTMRIDPTTGKAASSNEQSAIFETFRQQYAPSTEHTQPTSNAPNIYAGNSVY